MKQAAKNDHIVGKTLVCAGSNLTLGQIDPAGILRWALAEMSERLCVQIDSSPFYRTPAYPAGLGPDFVNAACTFETELSPTEILDVLHSIEADADRKRTQRWGPRTLDLDLIAVGNNVLPDLETWQYWRCLSLEHQQQETPQELILPHPRVQDRAFALVPLNDVAPDWQHPVLGKTIAQLLAACSPSEIASVELIK